MSIEEENFTNSCQLQQPQLSCLFRSEDLYILADSQYETCELHLFFTVRSMLYLLIGQPKQYLHRNCSKEIWSNNPPSHLPRHDKYMKLKSMRVGLSIIYWPILNDEANGSTENTTEHTAAPLHHTRHTWSMILAEKYFALLERWDRILVKDIQDAPEAAPRTCPDAVSRGQSRKNRHPTGAVKGVGPAILKEKTKLRPFCDLQPRLSTIGFDSVNFRSFYPLHLFGERRWSRGAKSLEAQLKEVQDQFHLLGNCVTTSGICDLMEKLLAGTDPPHDIHELIFGK